MGTFSKLLESFKKLRKSEEQWQNKNELYAIRAFWLALATLLTVLIGTGLSFAGLVIGLCIIITFCLSSILFPIAFLISNRHWNSRQKSFALSDDDFDVILYLENKHAAEIKRIENLSISNLAKSKLILEEYKNFRRQVSHYENSIVTKGQNYEGLKQSKELINNINEKRIPLEIEQKILENRRVSKESAIKKREPDEQVREILEAEPITLDSHALGVMTFFSTILADLETEKKVRTVRLRQFLIDHEIKGKILNKFNPTKKEFVTLDEVREFGGAISGIKITKPEIVAKFNNTLAFMKAMETDFKDEV